MLTIDYLVVTYPYCDEAEAGLVSLQARTMAGKREMRLGFVGHAVPGLFVGDNPYTRRYMVQATGGMADIVARMIPERLDEIVSAARIDIACTTLSVDADAEVLNTKVKGGYKVVQYRDLTDRGATVYIGSPKSRMRMRIYNKSAEAGIDRQDGREYVRYELQLRNEYADRAWKAYRQGNTAAHYLALVMRMLDQQHYRMLSAAINDEAEELEPLFVEATGVEWANRRLLWIERTVVPAINRLLCEYPELTDKVKALLDDVPRRVV